MGETDGLRRSNNVLAGVDNLKNYMFVFSCVILVDNSFKPYAQKLSRYLLIYMTMFLIIAVCNYRCTIDVLIIQMNRYSNPNFEQFRHGNKLF